MSKTRVEFFAMPDEQRRWLESLVADDSVWCVVRQLPPSIRTECFKGTEFLANLSFANPEEIGGVQLYFGLRDHVHSPVWRTTEEGKQDIDFIRSQAIQYDPSVLVGEHILLEGQMAILSQVQYEAAGIDPRPLQGWFRQVAKSLKNLNAANGVILRDPALGKEKEYPDIVVTSGALEWRSSGHLLKQFVNGAYEFDCL